MKILTALLKYDYGIRTRGESLELKAFFPALNQIGDVIPFWLEENGFPNNIDELQKKLIATAEKESPDYIFFILMKDEIKIETIQFLSKKYKTINWFCDDQWRFNDFTKYVAPNLTYSITMDKYSIDKFNKLETKIFLSQWATYNYIYDLEVDEIQYKYDISFVGGKNITREWFINELKEAGYNVTCFGNGWDNGKVSFEEMSEIFKRSKINLNLSNSMPNDYRFFQFARKKLYVKLLKIILNLKIINLKKYYKNIKSTLSELRQILKSKKNTEQIKARNFEIPGAGGFQLSQYALEIEDYYDIGKEIAVFSSIDEMKIQIKFYLNNDAIRKAITIKSYEKTKGYTYKERLKKVFEEIEKS